MSFYQHERGWLDSEVWGSAPYSEREAWSWMIGEAAWKDRTVNVKGHPVEVKRGTFTASLRFLAEKWQWKKDKVSRFLTRLENWQMIEIETASATGQTVVRVCNYNIYQSNQEEDATAGETETRQTRDSNATNKNKYQINSKKIDPPEGVSETVWNDFLKIRKAKRAPISETALNGIRKEAQKLGWNLEKALTECCSRGWQSFKAEWITKDAVRQLTPSKKPIQPSLEEAMAGYDFT